MKKVKLLAFVSAVATALLLFVFLNSLSRPVETAKAKVLTAAADIPANTPITSQMITLTALPAEAIIAGALTDTSQVVGKITEGKIFAGEQMLRSKLISAGGNGSKTLAYAIKPDMRAVTIAVDTTSGVANMITPGNHIDLIGEFVTEKTAVSAGGSSEKQKKSYTTMVLQNITVLAVDNVLSEPAKVKTEAPPPYTSLTLQVTPKQAMELSMAQFEGQLKAILRSPVDEKETKLPSLTLDDIMVK